jgi:hypothetical protein
MAFLIYHATSAWHVTSPSQGLSSTRGESLRTRLHCTDICSSRKIMLFTPSSSNWLFDNWRIISQKAFWNLENKAVQVAALGHLRNLNKNVHARVTRLCGNSKRMGTRLAWAKTAGCLRKISCRMTKCIAESDKVYCRMTKIPIPKCYQLTAHFICRMISFQTIQIKCTIFYGPWENVFSVLSPNLVLT